jgi:hypothetical protein
VLATQLPIKKYIKKISTVHQLMELIRVIEIVGLATIVNRENSMEYEKHKNRGVTTQKSTHQKHYYKIFSQNFYVMMSVMYGNPT